MTLLGPLAASARPLAGLTGCCGIYLEAHFACSCLAWKTLSRPKLPSASACELSLKKGIGWGFCPAVQYIQELTVLRQDKVDFCWLFA